MDTKKSIFSLALCALLVIAWGCDKKEPLSSEAEKNQTVTESVTHSEPVRDKNTIYIATEEYPPYTSENMKHNGIDCHVVREAFALEGIKVIYEFYPGSRSYMLAENGHVDGTVPWARRKGREDIFYFSDPVIESDTEQLHYLKGFEFKWNSIKRDYNDLKGLRIGAIISHNYDEKFQAAEKSGIITVERVASLKQNFEMLLKGHIDLLICQNRVGNHVLKTHFTKEQIELIGKKAENSDPVDYDYLLLSKKKDTSIYFRDAFNKGMKKLRESGKYSELMKDLRDGKYIIGDNTE
jgi:polar amino acid transport system substrate-binding protein